MLHKIIMPVASNGYLLMCKLQSEVSVLPVLADNGQSFAPIGLYKTDAASDWLLIKRTALVEACRKFSYKINRIT
jgi:hypothetical protein